MSWGFFNTLLEFIYIYKFNMYMQIIYIYMNIFDVCLPSGVGSLRELVKCKIIKGIEQIA